MSARLRPAYGRAGSPVNDAARQRSSALAVAGRAARDRLIERHRDEYVELYREEAGRRGERLPALERRCPCGQGTVRRLTFIGRWPRVCEACSGGGG